MRRNNNYGRPGWGPFRRGQPAFRREAGGFNHPPFEDLELETRQGYDVQQGDPINAKLDRLLDRFDKWDVWRDETDRRFESLEPALPREIEPPSRYDDWEEFRRRKSGEKGYRPRHPNFPYQEGESDVRGRRAERFSGAADWDSPRMRYGRPTFGGWQQRSGAPTSCWDPPQRYNPTAAGSDRNHVSMKPPRFDGSGAAYWIARVQTQGGSGRPTVQMRPLMVRVSQAEKAERARMGLCYYCPDKWVIGHECKQRLLCYAGEDDMFKEIESRGEETHAALTARLNKADLIGESLEKRFKELEGVERELNLSQEDRPEELESEEGEAPKQQPSELQDKPEEKRQELDLISCTKENDSKEQPSMEKGLSCIRESARTYTEEILEKEKTELVKEVRLANEKINVKPKLGYALIQRLEMTVETLGGVKVIMHDKDDFEADRENDDKELPYEGVMKCLLATKTVNIGLNMPAKSVVFTNVQDFDEDYYVGRRLPIWRVFDPGGDASPKLLLPTIVVAS